MLCQSRRQYIINWIHYLAISSLERYRYAADSDHAHHTLSSEYETL